MTKKTAQINDVHFDARNSNMSFHDNQMQFVKETFLPFLSENDIERVLVAGDLFDNRQTVNIKILDSVCRNFFDQLTQYEVVLIVGNHDVYYRNRNDVSLVRLIGKMYPNVKVVDESPVVLDRQAMIPWINPANTVAIKKFLGDLDPKAIDSIHLHYDDTCDHEITELLYSAKKMNIVILSGHWHIRKEFGPVFMNGAMFKSTFADVDEAAGFSVIQERDVYWVDNENSWVMKFKTIEDLFAVDPESVRGKNIMVTSSEQLDDEGHKKLVPYRDAATRLSYFYMPEEVIGEFEDDMESGFDVSKYIERVLEPEPSAVRNLCSSFLNKAETNE